MNDKTVDVNISTHAPHAGRDSVQAFARESAEISTHAPHAGRDAELIKYLLGGDDFYSRAPCGTRRRRVSGGK